MTIVTITLTDTDDGGVSLKIVSDPPFTNDQCSPAQYLALSMLEEASKHLGPIQSIDTQASHMGSPA